jgi:hypothetical protein
MSRILEFFTESGQVFTNPDDLFYMKTEGQDYNGVISLIFYSLMLALVLGITSGDIVVTGILLVLFLIFPLLAQFIHSIFVFIFAKILGGSGNFMNTFNLLSYSSVLNLLLIIGIALLSLGKIVIIPLVILVSLWKIVIEIIAVSEEHNMGYAKSFLSTVGIPLIISVIIWGLI